MVCRPDGDTDFFNIVAGVLQGNTLAPHMFIICLDYIFRMTFDLIKESGLSLKKTRWYPIKTMTDVDYTDDLALIKNTPTQAESLLHSLEWAVGGVGLCEHKTEFTRKHLHFKCQTSKISRPVHICW